MSKERLGMVRKAAAGFFIFASLASGGYSFREKSLLEQEINNTNNPKISQELQGKKTIYEALTGLSIASAAGAGSIGLNPRKKNEGSKQS